MKKILFRPESGKNIGMGHLNRSIIASKYLSQNFKISCQILASNELASINYLNNKKVNYSLINRKIAGADESLFIRNMVIDQKFDLIILDILDNDICDEFMTNIKSANVPVIVITDDSYKRVVNANIIINANPLQIEFDYSNEVGDYYIGPRYFIMDTVFSKKCDQVTNFNNVKKILISVGGSDHNNIVFKILDAIKLIKGQFEIVIVSSIATGYINKLKNYILHFSHNITLKVDIDNLRDDICWSDFTITAGGNTLFERIAQKKPGLTICQLERQMEIANKFQEFYLNFNVGMGTELNVKKIEEGINFFLNNFDKLNKGFDYESQLVDGKGLIRFSKIVNKILKL